MKYWQPAGEAVPHIQPMRDHDLDPPEFAAPRDDGDYSPADAAMDAAIDELDGRMLEDEK